MKQVGLSQICAAVRVEVVLLLLVATSFLTTGLSYLSAREPPHTRPCAHPLYPSRPGKTRHRMVHGHTFL